MEDLYLEQTKELARETVEKSMKVFNKFGLDLTYELGVSNTRYEVSHDLAFASSMAIICRLPEQLLEKVGTAMDKANKDRARLEIGPKYMVESLIDILHSNMDELAKEGIDR